MREPAFAYKHIIMKNVCVCVCGGLSLFDRWWKLIAPKPCKSCLCGVYARAASL